MRYNKGEWSEIYTYLKCLVDGKFYVKDSSLENILSEYEILEIFRKNYLNNVDCIFNPKKINSTKYNHEVEKLLEKLLSTNTTTFELPELENFAKIEDFSLSKGSSFNKSDLDARIKDHYGVESNKKEYSIKSQLGNPPTLLNASSHTNFVYRIKNISLDDVIEINKIKTRAKLKDRIAKIYEKQYSIESLGAESEIFSYNLKYIDGDLEAILSKLLLNSYRYETKKLSDLISILTKESPLSSTEKFYHEKISRFLSEITASMLPGTPSENLKASNNIFGGVLLVERNGKISLLDNLHYKEELKKYLSENLKLESPSSTRYNMLNLNYDELKKEAVFTLNLQIRFIR